jgi:hypothetical protein
MKWLPTPQMVEDVLYGIVVTGMLFAALIVSFI